MSSNLSNLSWSTRKKQLVAGIAAFVILCFVAVNMHLGSDHLRQLPHILTSSTHESHEPSTKDLTSIPVTDGKVLKADEIASYVRAIFFRSVARLDSFQCPMINETRYAALTTSPGQSDPTVRYFFALNIRDKLGLLPRLMGSIIEAIKYLGPEHCMLSILEGNSPDGTADVLNALRPHLESLGITYFMKSSDIDPTKTDRITALAELRNLALAPLVKNMAQVTSDTSVIFLNDVAACPDDILELVYQRHNLGADMVCAMDWNLEPPRFYDIWIARGMTGDSFIDVPNGNWSATSEIFWNDQLALSRYNSYRPFQVFACWNGGAVFGAGPTIENLRFRASKEGECHQGEPQLFCKDMWFRGYRKIAVVPSVNFEYYVDMGKKTKQLRGYTSDIVSNQDPADDHINWQHDPPAQVKCLANWGDPTWGPWDEVLS